MSQDKICLEGVSFYGYHGANPEERARGQRFIVDLEIERDLAVAGRSDRLEDTTNYSHVYRVVEEVMMGPSHHLLESLAEDIAQKVLASFVADAVRVRIQKTAPPIKGAILSGVAVEIIRRRVQ